MTEIKLTAAMEKALSGAEIAFSPNFGVATGVVAPGTKSQTVKALNTRGLATLAGVLTPEGVEAAVQLGRARPEWKAPGTPLAAAQIEQEIAEGIITPHPDRVAPEATADGLTDATQVDQQGEEIETLSESLDRSFPKTDDTDVRDTTAVEDVLRKAVDLNKPHVVPNRKDRRKARGIRAALSRLTERRRVRKVRKYGSTKIGAEVAA